MLFDASVRLGEFQIESFQRLGDDKAAGGRLLDEFQVDAQFGEVVFDQPGSLTKGGLGGEFLDEGAEGGLFSGQLFGHCPVLLERRGSNEAEGAVHHNRTLARRVDRTTQVGDAGFCQPRAVLDDLVKGEIGHQTGTQGQQDATQQADIELRPDPETEPLSLFRFCSFCRGGRTQGQCFPRVGDGAVVVAHCDTIFCTD